MEQPNKVENNIPHFDLRELIGEGRKLVIINRRFHDVLLYEPLFLEARKFLEESGYKVLVEDVDSEADSVSHLPEVLRIENVLPSIINLYDVRKKNPTSLQDGVCYVVSALRKSNVIDFPKVENEYERMRENVVSNVMDFPKAANDENFFAREINGAKALDSPNTVSIDEGKLEQRISPDSIVEDDETIHKPKIIEVGPVYERNPASSSKLSSNNKELPNGYISKPFESLYMRSPFGGYLGMVALGLGNGSLGTGLENTFYNHQRARALTHRWTNTSSPRNPTYYRRAA